MAIGGCEVSYCFLDKEKRNRSIFRQTQAFALFFIWQTKQKTTQIRYWI